MKRTAEHVGKGHPDKFCDQVADGILDATLAACGHNHELRNSVRTAIEALASGNRITISGEVNWPPEFRSRISVSQIAREIWKDLRYGHGEQLEVVDAIQRQSADIARGVDNGGAGDQGIMVGYATDETPEMLPREYLYSREICMRLETLRRTGDLPWLRSDMKSQVTIDGDGRPVGFIVAAQHAPLQEIGLTLEEVRELIFETAVRPVLGPDVPKTLSKINGCGVFESGGPAADAGVVGRKIVVDQYGPQVPVGGGAFSGKDPTKVDRSAAYMARHIAKTVVANQVKGAKTCTVKIAYGIGQIQPEMVTAITDTGANVSGWVLERFPDLSPGHIIARLNLRNPAGWTYRCTAAFGHFGRGIFPWEAIA
ncbi:MAG TPA: methionine adenosyltransferase [Verrucomicrobiales bacterium]|nr:methionine adenosyltransferase [Verrucomicrobiales bacterium]